MRQAMCKNNYPDQADKSTDNFKLALKKLVWMVLNHDEPHDVMLIWVAPNGGIKRHVKLHGNIWTKFVGTNMCLKSIT